MTTTTQEFIMPGHLEQASKRLVPIVQKLLDTDHTNSELRLKVCGDANESGLNVEVFTEIVSMLDRFPKWTEQSEGCEDVHVYTSSLKQNEVVDTQVLFVGKHVHVTHTQQTPVDHEQCMHTSCSLAHVKAELYTPVFVDGANLPTVTTPTRVLLQRQKWYNYGAFKFIVRRSWSGSSRSEVEKLQQHIPATNHVYVVLRLQQEPDFLTTHRSAEHIAASVLLKVNNVLSSSPMFFP